MRDSAFGWDRRVTDDPAREDEDDLIMAAQHATPQTVAYFLDHTSGYLCVSVSQERAGAQQLYSMRGGQGDRQGTAFLTTVDLHQGTSTGIIARDRATTIRALAEPHTRPANLDRPGRDVPLLARDGGVLERRGHVEADVELCRMAGLQLAALMRGCNPGPSGAAPRPRRHCLGDRPGSAAAVDPGHHPPPPGRHRRAHRRCGYPVRAGHLPGRRLPRRRHADRAPRSMDRPDRRRAAEPVRIHCECLTGDLFGSLRCDCGPQVCGSLEHFAECGRGVLIYHFGQRGRGTGIGARLQQAYELQQRPGLDTALGLPVDLTTARDRMGHVLDRCRHLLADGA
ncbi:3,4-dihydroxy-2-butanone-4-phosphate synthase [Streptomyces sp. NPDC048430]|uniref:3,4-dihydroxy-2-butanone-4-phosphate synthase n=1 Tax=Streptomyces sp. NPDC048430 TaxID=3155388 RepID=UPI00343D1239